MPLITNLLYRLRSARISLQQVDMRLAMIEAKVGPWELRKELGSDGRWLLGYCVAIMELEELRREYYDLERQLQGISKLNLALLK